MSIRCLVPASLILLAACSHESASRPGTGGTSQSGGYSVGGSLGVGGTATNPGAGGGIAPSGGASGAATGVGGTVNGDASFDGGAEPDSLLAAGGFPGVGGSGTGGAAGGSGGSTSTNPSVKSLALGSTHACALLDDGTVRCWGDNRGPPNSRKLGGSSTAASSSIPLKVSDLTTAVGITAASNHTVALLKDGTMKYWGIVDEYDSVFASELQADAAEARNIVGITAGGLMSYCLFLADGMVRCDDYFLSALGPMNAVAVAIGNYHLCLLQDGTVQCAGANTDGELGDGTTTDSDVPVTVANLTDVVAISAGYYHTCAVLTGGAVKCWGGNDFGQLGNGSTTPSPVPVAVSTITNAVAVVGGGVHTCAVLTDGTVRCWGDNRNGQLGDGTTVDSSVPVTVRNIASPAAVVAGGSSTCAVLSDRTATCWGGNGYGQLGDGTTSDSPVPLAVKGL